MVNDRSPGTLFPPPTLWRRIAWQAFVLLLLVAVARTNYLLFHSLAELFSIVIACAIFVVAWTARRHYHNDYLLFIGIAYLFVAFFDTLHTLGYHGMSVFRDLPGYNLGPQLWLVGRTMEAATLLVAPFFIRHRLRPGSVFAAYAAVSLLALWSIFLAGNFPVCFTPEQGLSPFKIAAEYFIIALLFAALALLIGHRRDFDRRVFTLLTASLILTAASELCFTIYISHYGFSNLLGHLFKILSFWLIYYAIVETALDRPFALLFRTLDQQRNDMLAAQSVARAGSWSWRPETNVMNWTPGVFLHLGLAPEPGNMTLAGFLSAVPEEERPVLAGALEALREHGQPFQLEVSRCDPDGTRHFLQIKGARSAGPEGEDILAGMVQDISERIAAEQLREDMDRIARHDLRSPLTAIIGYSQYLLAQPGALTDDQRQSLEIIRQSGSKMHAMLDSSLTLYKIEQGTYQLQGDSFDLHASIRDVIRELEEKGKLLGVEMQLRPALPERDGGAAWCFGEKLLCQTLFANLIGNAIEASKPGERVTVVLGENAGDWQVTIHNQGEVPEPVRRRFFEKYATYGKSGGTGLGTYSALLVARAHGGSIALDSGGGGTTLTVTLPKNPVDRFFGRG